MADEEQEGRSGGQDDMPHGHEGSDREGGQVGVGVGGLGGGQAGTASDQGRGYGAEGGPARHETSEEEQDMPHGHEGSDREGPQVGVGTGGLGGQEWPTHRVSDEGDGASDSEEASGQN